MGTTTAAYSPARRNVFTRTAGVWTQQAKLTAADGAAGDVFGAAVAVSGDTAVVGAYQDDDRGGDSGSAYVFTRTGGVWSQQAKLTAADGSTGDSFGASVALSGDTVVVGAYGDDSYGDDGYGGQDFIYDSGSAYAFARTGGAWTQQAKLTADTDMAGNSFGISVAVSGDTAVVGAYRDDAPGANSGSAYAFTRAGGTWARYSKLTPVDGAAGDSFGVSVALSGDTAVIGAYGDDDRASESGSAYAILLGVDGDGDGVADSADFCPGTAPGAPVSDAGCALEQSSGTPGPAGPQGAAGSNGLNGVNGFDGAQGPAGPQGPAGAQGPQGEPGAPGPQGPAGADGANGLNGSNGVDGAAGAPGTNGTEGPVGPQGPSGPAGTSGANGADGAPGTPGANGLNGVDGAAGPQGPAGTNGVNGANGATGANGAEGPAGPQGPTGPAGASGANGADGAPGTPGANGLNGVDGAAGPQGPAGTNGLNGANGAVGPPGPQGPAGTNGQNGTNGVNGAPGPQGSPGGVPSGTVIFLQSTIPAPAGYTLIGSFDQVVHIGHDQNGRDHDDERERRNGRDQVLRLRVYRKN